MHERDLFIAALEIDDGTARRVYLDSACAGDVALRSRVERLLSREVAAGDFLEQPAADLCSDLGDAGPTEISESPLSSQLMPGSQLLTIDICSDVGNAGPTEISESPPPPSSQWMPGSELRTVVGQVGDTAKTMWVNPLSAVTASSSRVANSSPVGVTESAAALETLFGRYRVERVLGSGGMGVVYLAEDLRLCRRVALKIPKFDADADGTFQLIERFRREARTMASVLHRNLCPIFDVDEQNGTHYLTMAFIDGETLAQVIKREKPAGQGSRETSDRTLTTSATRIAELICKLALALAEAHRAGVIHRDLKPANVMIDRTGEPVLMDFGLAWRTHEADARVTQSGAIVGTPAYMSPEQAEGDQNKVGVASDIYSLGAILYELLAGRPIHTGSVTRVLFKLMHDAPTRPSAIRGDVDPQLDAICWKAIARRPEDRFATVGEFAEALGRFLAGDSPLTRSVSEGERGTGPVMPSPVKRPPSLTLRVSEPDQTDVLPSDSSEETIAYQTPGVRGLTTSGSSSSMAPRGKSRIVLASLLLIGLIGAVWAIVTSSGTPKQNEVALNPKGEDRPAAKSPVSSQQKTVADPEPSPNVVLEVLMSSDWEWTKPENLGPAVNTAVPETSPHFSADGKRLWFQRGFDSNTDRACIAERETPDKPWNPAQSIGSAIEFSGPMADLFISRDEQTWMFVTWGPENYSQQVFESTRPTPMADWSEPKLVAAASSPALFPVLSDDGLTLYITNARDSDSLYALTRRTTTESWSEPQRLPIPPNIAHGGFRTVWNSVDGRVLVFHTARGTSGSATQYDLWLTTRSSTAEPWQEPISFGPTINSTANERGACLSDDGRELIFASDRPGGMGDTDLYVSRRVRKQDITAASPFKLELAAPLPSVTSAAGLKLDDLDGDGDLDLFVATLKSPCVMLRNDGKGNFTDSGQQLGDNASFAVALGDLDGDGDLDAFVCNSDEQENAIWLNDGRGTFQRAPQSFPPSKSNDVALIDVDSDTDLDAVVSNWNGFVEIWFNEGTGQFTTRQKVTQERSTGIALGDLDADSDADLVITSHLGHNQILLNDGQGRFLNTEQTFDLPECTSAALGDLDRDGDLDLFLTSHRGNEVWFNDGRGHFHAGQQQLGDGRCEAVELVDLDADHDLDAVTIGDGFEVAKPRSVWRNDGNGRFAIDAATLKTGHTQSLASGDLDGDGDADIVFGNLAGPAEAWLNQSNLSTIP